MLHVASRTELGFEIIAEFTSCAKKKKSEPMGPSPAKSGQVRPPPTSLRLPAGRTGATGSIFHAAVVETASCEHWGDCMNLNWAATRSDLVQIVDLGAK